MISRRMILAMALMCSACATGTPSRMSMNTSDLSWFAYDCSRSREQMAFLNSLRRSDDDQLFSISGWTGEDRHRNWLINYHIRYLRDYC